MQCSNPDSRTLPRGRQQWRCEWLPEQRGEQAISGHPPVFQRLVLHQEEQGRGAYVTHYPQRTDDAEGEPTEVIKARDAG